MKIANTEWFGAIQNDHLSEDPFSSAEFALMLFREMLRSRAGDGESVHPGGGFDIDSRSDTAGILNKHTESFRESLFGALLDAVIGVRTRQHHDSKGCPQDNDNARALACRPPFDGYGIARDGDAVPSEHEAGYRGKPALSDDLHYSLLSQILHLAIIGQDHEAVPGTMAGSHQATGQCFRRTCFRASKKSCVEGSARNAATMPAVRCRRACRAGVKKCPWRSSRQSSCVLHKVQVSQGLRRWRAHKK